MLPRMNGDVPRPFEGALVRLRDRRFVDGHRVDLVAMGLLADDLE
jgi:hypothetical protein